MSDDNDLNHGNPSADDLLDELGSLRELLDEERVASVRSVHEISSVEEYMRLKKEAEDAGTSIESYLAQLAVQEENEEEASNELDESVIPVLDEVYVEEEPSAAEEQAEAEPTTPTTASATTVDEYFAAVAASRELESETASPVQEDMIAPPEAEDAIPVLDQPITEEQAIPELEEVVAEEETIPQLEEVVEAGNTIPELDVVVESEEAVPLLDEAVEQVTPELQEAMSLEEIQELVNILVERKLQHLRPELEKEVMEELKKLLPISAFS